jgi:hypothetical protein
MKALLIGFISVFAVALGLGFLIQYPAVFWTILFGFVIVILLAIWNGSKQSPLKDPERIKRRNAAFNQSDGITEDDIVHHHQPNGRPFDDRSGPSSILPAVAAGVAAAHILRPDENPAAPVVEPDPEIANAAAMYYDEDTDYSDE